MEPITRAEELIEHSLERVFAPRGEPEPAGLLRAARRALRRGRRGWFDAERAPNRVEIRVNPAWHARWRPLLRVLEHEIGDQLERIARDDGLVLLGRIMVEIVSDTTLAPGKIVVLASTTDPESQPRDLFVGPLVTPGGWRLTGRRPLARVSLIARAPGGIVREHIIVFASRIVIGDSSGADVQPPSGTRVATSTLAVLGERIALKPLEAARGDVVRPQHRGPGNRLWLARRYGGDVRVARRDGVVTSASIIARGWTFTMALEDVVIGRDPEASDILLEDAAVSRRHAVLALAPIGVVLEDAGSANSTVVNGRRITRAPLTPGDRVTVGRTDLDVLPASK